MRAWLIDSYQSKNKIVLWVKTPENVRVEQEFYPYVFLDSEAEDILRKHRICFSREKRKDYLGKDKNVLRVRAGTLAGYSSFVSYLERITRYRIRLYNADIRPEQHYLYRQRLRPFCAVRIEKGKQCIIPLKEEAQVHLKKMELSVIPNRDIRSNPDAPVKALVINRMRLEGEESALLKQFAREFIRQDPDVLWMDYGFSMLPYLQKRLIEHSIGCPFHRWDSEPIVYRGGRTFFTYGTVRYQDFAIRLHGRFLVDTSTVVGSNCDADAIMELCRLSGSCFQQTASKSFGAVFQASLIREMIEQGILVHYKTKPLEKPMSMFEMLKSDRGGHVFDCQPGFHRNVAEIDFCSMYPWIIYNHNIGSDSIQCDEPPFEKVPGIGVRVSMAKKSMVSKAIKPFIDKRMEYKRNPTAVNKQRAAGLKWVLVSSYGYLRYREFKLGIPSSHMAICAYAREVIVQAARLAEERGFEVVHGIVDSLYIKQYRKGKKSMEESIKLFCHELECITGIPVSFEGIFKWVCFLSSVTEEKRPVPTRYFGALENKGTKVRGIELRQRTPPLIVKYFQKRVLESMAECSTKKEIRDRIPAFCRQLSAVISSLHRLSAKWLACTMRISKTEYKHELPQKKILAVLKQKGISVFPGQTIQFVYQRGRVVLPDDYNGKPDTAQYKKLLARALLSLLQPFGVSMKTLLEWGENERQSTLREYLVARVLHVFVPLQDKDLLVRKAGLSEKRIRQRLEQQGWIVWRGGSLNILKRDDIYPNVRKKYCKLNILIEQYYPGMWETLQYFSFQSGMPDFICYRRGEFKFVECKLGHEQLSLRQKNCIVRLQELGFRVEVHKLVMVCTKARRAEINLINGKKQVLEVQMKICQA